MAPALIPGADGESESSSTSFDEGVAENVYATELAFECDEEVIELCIFIMHTTSKANP